MSLEALASAGPLPATEEEPQEIAALREHGHSLYIVSVREPRLVVSTTPLTELSGTTVWRIDVASAEGRVVSAPPVIDAEWLDPRQLSPARGDVVTESYRPPWADVEYLPKLVPHRVAFDRWRPYLSTREAAPMRVLHQHNFEAMSQSYPWRCVGRVLTFTAAGPGPTGTGVLVARIS
jgi:hypothetical protein